MPDPTRGALIDVVAPAFDDGVDFIRMPTWSGVPVETGAPARMQREPLVAACSAAYGNGAATRIVARMAEIARLLDELAAPQADEAPPPRVQGMTLSDHVGLAAVQTGRGLLLHRARVHDECVVDYEIVAPTEWNFHPDGALARGLVGLEAADSAALLRTARLCVHTLDPCVTSRVEIGHA
jgi:Ni,Fe-hydrogenase I large subunit